MHECPSCSQVCYCDLDDSNDCRDRGECFHACVEDEDFDDAWAEDDDDDAAPVPGTSPGDDPASPKEK